MFLFVSLFFLWNLLCSVLFSRSLLPSNEKNETQLQFNPWTIRRQEEKIKMANNQSQLRGDYFLREWDEERKQDAVRRIKTSTTTAPSPTFSPFWDTFNASANVATVLTHKQWLIRSFDRLGAEFFPLVTREQIERHDDSKLESFVELCGYTDRWVWQEDTEAWQEALQHHYDNNPHHPQYYIYNGTQSDMEPTYLEESILDMVASRWERRLNGDLSASNAALVDMDEKFLGRYTEADKKKVLHYLERIRSGKK